MPPIEDILECTLNRWSPEIGDPTVMGWVTVGAYFVAAVAGFICYRRARTAPWHPLLQKESWFWFLFLLLYVGLGINKQLDLQSGLTAMGRCVSKLEGWYDQRREFQLQFIMIMASIGLVVTVIGAGIFRSIIPRVWISILGIGVTICFVLIRAVGYHDFDAIISIRIFDFRMNWILELSGISLAGLGAMLAAKRLKQTLLLTQLNQQENPA